MGKGEVGSQKLGRFADVTCRERRVYCAAYLFLFLVRNCALFDCSSFDLNAVLT